MTSPHAGAAELLKRALKHIIDAAEARNFDPPAPLELVADLEYSIATFERDHLSAGWYGIESAPRDGTPFLATLIVRHINGRKWRETHLLWCDDETGEVHPDCERGWTWVHDYELWQPLPSPPTDLTGGE